MKKPNVGELRDLWLKKYHNTNSREVVEKHPEKSKTPEWFKLYPVTEEQYNEWVNDAKELLTKKYKLSKRMVELGWWSIELDCSPYISKNKK